jgi:hypothetical protein
MWERRAVDEELGFMHENDENEPGDALRSLE